MSTDFAHEPVMAAEIAEIFEAVPAGVVIDATLGGGGHARTILTNRPDLSVLGIDRDAAAVAAARRALAEFGDRVEAVCTGFERLSELLGGQPEEGRRGGTQMRRTATGEAKQDRLVVGALFDLGVSSPQLDHADRGFSFRHDGPLDMRMDTSQALTAAIFLNESPPNEIARAIRRYGEERFARAITNEIVRRRPLETTGDLAEAVTAGVPAPARRKGGHPARRTFQAIRIAVNDELAHLERGLDLAFAALAVTGRLAVLSYHSLEDRIVKRRFQDWATGGFHPPGLPTHESARGGSARVLTRRPLRPSPDEVARNPRAESARLRALEKTRAPDVAP